DAGPHVQRVGEDRLPHARTAEAGVHRGEQVAPLAAVGPVAVLHEAEGDFHRVIAGNGVQRVLPGRRVGVHVRLARERPQRRHRGVVGEIRQVVVGVVVRIHDRGRISRVIQAEGMAELVQGDDIETNAGQHAARLQFFDAQAGTQTLARGHTRATQSGEHVPLPLATVSTLAIESIYPPPRTFSGPRRFYLNIPSATEDPLMATATLPAAPGRVIRAPRGPERTCKGWIQEAALRMLMNNLDPEVAEDPDRLVVYG